MSDDTVEEVETEGEPVLQQVLVQSSSEDDETAAFCVVIDGQSYNIVPAQHCNFFFLTTLLCLTTVYLIIF